MLKRRLVKFCLAFASIFILVGCISSSEEAKVVKRTCNTAKCHNSSYYTKYNNQEGQWRNIVRSMKVKGAVYTDAEEKVIIDYLTKNHGPKY